MTRIRTRNPLGGEYSFTREEFVRAVERRGITADWQVYHATSGQWLPVTAHPAFPSTRASGQEPKRSSSELILIYPDPAQQPDVATPPTGSEIDDGPVLAPDEIDRVLGRSSGPQTLAEGPGKRGWSTAVRRVSGRLPTDFEVEDADPSTGGIPLFERVLILGILFLLIVAGVSAWQPSAGQSEGNPPAGSGGPIRR